MYSVFPVLDVGCSMCLVSFVLFRVPLISFVLFRVPWLSYVLFRVSCLSCVLFHVLCFSYTRMLFRVPCVSYALLDKTASIRKCVLDRLGLLTRDK